MSTNYVCIWIHTVLAHNYPTDKIQFVSGSNYAYSVTTNMLLTGLLFWQIFVVVLFTSNDFYITVFTVSEKAMSYQTHTQTREIIEAIHMIVTFSLHSDSYFRILLWVWEPEHIIDEYLLLMRCLLSCKLSSVSLLFLPII